MHCSYWESGVCQSCPQIDVPYSRQLADKDAHTHAALADFPSIEWLAPSPSRESGYRNKAKLAVSGTYENPALTAMNV